VLINNHCVLSREATNTDFIAFGLTRPGLELTIYRTRSEHANHYTTDAVICYDECVLLTYKEDIKYWATDIFQ
jgi:hypothetical protein